MTREAFTATRAIVRVDGGRGFIVGAGDERFVITAAHCVPPDRLPPPHLTNSHELTFRNIIGSLSSEKGAISAELCFYGLTDDIAVFVAPDGHDECQRYEEFTAAQAMTIGKLPDAAAPPPLLGLDADPAAFISALEERERHHARALAAYLLSLECEWQPCTVHSDGRFLTILDGAGGIKGGMSGSPIININGEAIGLVSTGGAGFNVNLCLTDCLPPWLLRKLDVTAAS